MQTFYTMMENLQNVHLTKDVGMIPAVLQKEYDFESYVVAYGEIEHFKYLQNGVSDIKLVRRPKYFDKNLLDGVIWLLKNATKIDILNLYHYKPSSFLWTLVYKLRNPRGKVFLKLDISYEAGIKMRMRKATIKYFLTWLIFRLCHIVSAESVAFVEYANKNWPAHLIYLPNGISEKDVQLFTKKEKMIITVGRLGTEQKATEILLKAFVKALPELSTDWKLCLVGNMTDEFCSYFGEYLDKNTTIADRIIWTGEISDRKKILSLLRKSAIFTMPSRWEGFSLAVCEAIGSGCFLMLSDLMSFREICFHEKYGTIFPLDDIDAYAKAMVNSCCRFDREGKLLESQALEGDLRGIFTWEGICACLAKKLNEKKVTETKTK